MEATIIRLEPTGGSSNVSVKTGTFEEAFGEYSEARGRGRERRKARRMERIANRRAVRTERRKLQSDRQEERLQRRSTRKQTRQEMRNQQQEARQNRRANVRDERQANREARNLRKMTNEEGDQERENYGQEQENYRESIAPQDSEQDTQGGGGYADEQGGGYADEQGGGYSDDQNGEASTDWGSAPESYDDQNSGDGGYGDDNSQETPYNQEQSEFGDDSYFNVEGMDSKNSISDRVKDLVARLQKNQSALKNLKDRRGAIQRSGGNTTGIVMRITNVNNRIFEIKNALENYAINGKTPEERKKRRAEIKLALEGSPKDREVGQYGGSEVPVESDLNASFEPNKITVPASSSFDDMTDYEYGDTSYLNADGVDAPIVSAKVTDLVARLRNNQKALKDFKQQRDLLARQGKPTGGLNNKMKEANDRIFNLKRLLEQYIINGKTQQERQQRRKEVQTAKGGGNADTESSNFDAYSDLGRPIIVNGVAQNDSDYSSDDLLTDSDEPTTIELFSNADGTNPNKKAFMSIAIGIGVGALAIYLAKKKGWI